MKKYRIFSNEMGGYISGVLDRKATDEEYDKKDCWCALEFDENIEKAILFNSDFLMSPNHEIWIYSENKYNITVVHIETVIFECWLGESIPTYIVEM